MQLDSLLIKFLKLSHITDVLTKAPIKGKVLLTQESMAESCLKDSLGFLQRKESSGNESSDVIRVKRLVTWGFKALRADTRRRSTLQSV